MKDKQVETSSSSSSSSEDEEEDEDDDDDDDDDEDSSDDDQSSSSTFDLDEESIKLINKVEKMIQRLNVKGVPEGSSLSKQAHTQDKEEGVQEQRPHINKIMG